MYVEALSQSDQVEVCETVLVRPVMAELLYVEV
jgi:hypothetical protein